MVPYGVRDESREPIKPANLSPRDAAERLPRELLVEDEAPWFGEELRRYGLLVKRRTPWFLWAPVLLAALAVAIWAGANAVAASVACALLLGFFWLVTSPHDRTS